MISLDVFGALGIDQPLAQQGQHFAICATALALVLIQDDLVEHIAQYLGLANDVDIAPVTRTADDHHPLLGRDALDGGHQRKHRIGIVPIVGDHAGAAVVEEVEAAGCGLRIVDE